MESRIVGPRGGSRLGAQSQPEGSILSAIIVGAKFGDTAIVAKEIFRTYGAKTGIGATPSKKYPLLLQVLGHILTAFDGTNPVFTLTETNIDDSGSTTIANIASFSSGLFSTHKVLTVDKKYKLTYTPATGTPTTGEAYFAIKVCGPGLNGL